MSSAIIACVAIVANLTVFQTSMVSQSCPPDLVVEKAVEPEIIPRVKPEMPKCRKGEKQWRTLANGHRKYRLRRTC